MIPESERSIEVAFLKAVESVLLPPGLFLLLILVCFALRKMNLAGPLLVLTGLLFYVNSLPASLAWLSRLVDPHPTFNPTNHACEAIVVIGGGRYVDTPEYHGDTVNHLTLERLRYASKLHRQSGLPILVSGGKSPRDSTSEAEMMQKILTEEFSSQVRWVESESRTTFENAILSAKILKASGIKKIALVTHSYHMPRALEAFQQTGMSVTPAATIFFGRRTVPATYHRWLPSRTAAYWNNLLIHELLGRIWYRIRYFSSAW